MPILEMGKVINVDIENFTGDVHCEMSGRIHQEIQVVSPYMHHNQGEGMSIMPEVGAVCLVAMLSDSNPPVVLAFGAALEEMYVEEESDPPDTQELEDEGALEAEEPPDEESAPSYSYRNGRPLQRMGTIALTTRDGNFLKLRRGGVVQIGSNPMTQTIFMPIRNTIRTFAENWELDLVGGASRWEVVQEEDGSSSCKHTAVFREYAEQANASAYVEIGDLDENFFRVRMLMEGINPTTGAMEQSPVFEITLSKEGDIVLACKSNTVTIEEDQTIEVKGTQTEIFGKLDREVKGEQKVKYKTENREGTSSKEKLKSKLIEADSVILGGTGGAQPVVLGNKLVSFLASLTLPVSGAVAGPPDPTAIARLATLLSTTV
jgi:hypothetical protein